MPNFLKLLLASCLGTLLALGALVLLGILSIGSLASQFADGEVAVKNNSVLTLDLGRVPELTNNLQRDPFSLDDDAVLGLRDLRRVLEAAAEDDDVEGVYLDASGAALMPAGALELRRALAGFRESGKFVVSHGKYYTQSGYYLASVGDGVYLNPTGLVDIRGYGSVQPFFKGTLDKLGVDANVVYAGDFKSAGEMFFRRSMSDSNRLQTREYLADLWEVYATDVAASRGLTYAQVNALAEDFRSRDDDDAVELGLVDALYYKDQVLDELRRRIGLDDDDEIATVSAEDYYGKLDDANVLAKDRVALVYAEGNIADGEGAPGTITDGQYAKLLRELRTDDRVKAIVLRVNSGGGSAMASENIWRELHLATEAGIPVVTSMGGVAASGGYYIAAPSDSIFAEPNTLTGSIGVVAIIPNVNELMNDKLGVTFDTIGTGRYTNALSPVIPYSSADMAFFQESIDEIYTLFVNRVAEGRGLPEARVRQIAKGRVWTGRDALDVGLVDRLGSLDEALAAAADLADLELDDVRVVEYPRLKSPREQLIAELTGQDEDEGEIRLGEALLRRELGDVYERVAAARQLLTGGGAPQMRMYETLELR